MTKADLVEEVSRITELTRKDSEVIVDTLFDSVIKALKTGDKLEVRGFGSFRVRQRNARVGRNPKTGEKVEVPAKRVPYFKPSKELKDLINEDGTTVAPATPSETPVAPTNPSYGFHLEPVALRVSGVRREETVLLRLLRR